MKKPSAKRFRMTGLALIALFIFSACSSESTSDSSGSAQQTFTFLYGNQQPEGHARTQSMVFFKDEIEKRTGGRIMVEIHHSGTMGTEKEMFEMVANGQLQGYRGAFYDQLNSQFMLYNLPFLFQNYEQMIAFNASDMAADMCATGSVNGVYIPAVGYTGFRTIANKIRPIKMPEDMVGLKVRAPGQAPIIKFYQAVGANPQEMAWSEVYMAIKQGVIDGLCNAATNVEAGKMYEVAPHYTVLNYMAGADPLMVNDAWYQALPDDLKEIFNQVSKEALMWWDQKEKEAADKSVANIAGQPGVETIYTADDPEALAAWQEACQPLWQDFVDEGFFSTEDIKRVQEIIAGI